MWGARLTQQHPNAKMTQDANQSNHTPSSNNSVREAETKAKSPKQFTDPPQREQFPFTIVPQYRDPQRQIQELEEVLQIQTRCQMFKTIPRNGEFVTFTGTCQPWYKKNILDERIPHKCIHQKARLRFKMRMPPTSYPPSRVKAALSSFLACSASS